MTNKEFDPVRLAKRLDHMADKQNVRAEQFNELVSEIEEVRAEWHNCRRYPEIVWTEAFKRHLEDNPRMSYRRCRFARQWVRHLHDMDNPDTQGLIRAWLDYRDAHCAA